MFWIELNWLLFALVRQITLKLFNLFLLKYISIEIQMLIKLFDCQIKCKYSWNNLSKRFFRSGLPKRKSAKKLVTFHKTLNEQKRLSKLSKLKFPLSKTIRAEEQQRKQVLLKKIIEFHFLIFLVSFFCWKINFFFQIMTNKIKDKSKKFFYIEVRTILSCLMAII